MSIKLSSVITSTIIQWIDNDSFEVEINLPLRKAGVDSITGYEDYLRIWFIDDSGVDVEYPDNMNNLPEAVERELLKWRSCEEGHALPAYIIERIVNYIKTYSMQIKEAVEKVRSK